MPSSTFVKIFEDATFGQILAYKGFRRQEGPVIAIVAEAPDGHSVEKLIYISGEPNEVAQPVIDAQFAALTETLARAHIVPVIERHMEGHAAEPAETTEMVNPDEMEDGE